MRHSLGRRRYHALGIVLTLAAGLAVWFFLSTQAPAEPIVVSRTDLGGLSSGALDQAGYELSVLDATVQPKVARSQAEKLGLEHAPGKGTAVLDAIFARVATKSLGCRPACDAWIVNLDVDSCCPSIKWHVVFLNPETGEFLFAVGAENRR